MKTKMIIFYLLLFCSTILHAQNLGLHVEDGEHGGVLFGKDTIGVGFKLMFLPDLEAFRVGTITSSFATYWNIDSIGINSFASGVNTRAIGQYSTAFGTITRATGESSTAFGRLTIAAGYSSTAMGNNSDALGLSSTAMGFATNATGESSTAMGGLTNAVGKYSTAMGLATNATANRSIAMGSYNIGFGDPDSWIDDDPILEVGIGQFGQTSNALTILKDGRHGIMTIGPKANLHVKDDGVAGSGTIVAVLESSVSDRPILQFSETANGDANSGMSIEYDGSGAGSNNKMHINDTNGAPTVTFESGGDVGIGVINPSFALHLPNNSASGEARAFSWTTYSDQRIKSNIKASPYGLQSILLLRPVIYSQHNATFTNSALSLEEASINTVGLLAQEVHAVIPEAVTKPNDENEELWGMSYEKLIPVLIKGIQEQQEQIDAFQEKIISLEEEVKLLKSKESEKSRL